MAVGLSSTEDTTTSASQAEEDSSDSSAEKEEIKRAMEEKARRRKNREKIKQDVVLILTKEKQHTTDIYKFTRSLGIDARFVCPVQSGSVQQFVHFLDIVSVSSASTDAFSIRTRRGTLTFKSDYVDDILYYIRYTFATTFPGMPEFKWEIDSNRLPIVQVDVNSLPLGGLLTTYSAYCTYFNLPYQPDIAWDLQHIDHKSGSFTQFDFGALEQPLETSDIRALCAALRYNRYFNGISLRGLHLPKESMLLIIELIKLSENLTKIEMTGNVITRDYYLPLAEAFAFNAEYKHIKYLDVSNNPNMDEKGLQFVVKYLEGAKELSLQHVDISNCDVGGKTFAAMFTNLRKSTTIWGTLQYLNVSGNSLTSEALGALCAFLATPCSLKQLHVANCQIKMDTLLEAVMRGCLYLSHLDISGNKITKGTASILLRLLQGSSTLVSMNISNTSIPPSSFADILRAISNNPYLVNFTLVADQNELGNEGAIEFGICTRETGLKGIVELSLRENEFDDDGMLHIFKTLTTSKPPLRILRLDGNFRYKDRTTREQVVNALASYISSLQPLRVLSIAGGDKASQQLKTDILLALWALAKPNNIEELNISGHRIGNKGVFMLARAIQRNRTLKRLYWDDNAITVEGFEHFVSMLKSNTTLLECPIPVLDISSLVVSLKGYDSNSLQRLLRSISTLQQCIAANHSRASANSGMSAVIPPAHTHFLTNQPAEESQRQKQQDPKKPHTEAASDVKHKSLAQEEKTTSKKEVRKTKTKASMANSTPHISVVKMTHSSTPDVFQHSSETTSTSDAIRSGRPRSRTMDPASLPQPVKPVQPVQSDSSKTPKAGKKRNTDARPPKPANTNTESAPSTPTKPGSDNRGAELHIAEEDTKLRKAAKDHTEKSSKRTRQMAALSSATMTVGELKYALAEAQKITSPKVKRERKKKKGSASDVEDNKRVTWLLETPAQMLYSSDVEHGSSRTDQDLTMLLNEQRISPHPTDIISELPQNQPRRSRADIELKRIPSIRRSASEGNLTSLPPTKEEPEKPDSESDDEGDLFAESADTEMEDLIEQPRSREPALDEDTCSSSDDEDIGFRSDDEEDTVQVHDEVEAQKHEEEEKKPDDKNEEQIQSDDDSENSDGLEEDKRIEETVEQAGDTNNTEESDTSVTFADNDNVDLNNDSSSDSE